MAQDVGRTEARNQGSLIAAARTHSSASDEPLAALYTTLPVESTLGTSKPQMSRSGLQLEMIVGVGWVRSLSIRGVPLNKGVPPPACFDCRG
ncbi:hypothetical protein J6590_003068 [Homalodisca vitripennis]|nr:hypothetical protein J6590_003068 [Homalodisca vitripennis]